MRVSALVLAVTVMATCLPQGLCAEKPVSLTGHIGGVQHVGFSPDGQRLVSVAPLHSMKVWDVETQEVVVSLGDRRRDAYHNAQFSSDGSLLAARGTSGVTPGSRRHIIAVWDTTDWHNTVNWESPRPTTDSVCFWRDGEYFLAGGGLDGRYFVWNLQTGEKAAESPQFQQQLADVVVTPDGKTLICRLFHGLGRRQEWSGQSRIVGWDIVDGGVQPLIEDIPGEIVCLTISADGRWFAAGGSQGPSPLRRPGQLVLWDRYSQPISLGGHRGIVWCISFSPNGRILASGGHDRMIRLWDTLSGELTQQLRGHKGPIHSLAFSPDGTLLASGSDDKTVRVWNISD